MSQQYTYAMKGCATCAYWAGERTMLDRFGQRLQVPSPMTRGKCMSRTSGWNNQEKQANAGNTCRGWEKWPPLK